MKAPYVSTFLLVLLPPGKKTCLLHDTPSAWILEGEMHEADPNPTSSLNPGAAEPQGTHGLESNVYNYATKIWPCYVV